MTKFLVLQLQEIASSDAADVTTLLRKAMLVASKLSLQDFRSWIDAELNGYAEGPVPEYRKTRGVLRCRNPYHGFIPFVIADSRLADAVQNVEMRDPIGNLVHLLQNDDSNGMLIHQLPDSITALLMRGQDSYAPLPPVRFISTGAVASVIDAVRSKILDWSLQLESEGILGEGMQFTVDEKQKAATTQSVHIQNFQGIFGNVDGQSEVRQHLNLTIAAHNFESLAAYLRSARVSDTDIAALREALDSDPPATSASTLGVLTSQWIGSMVSKAATGAWDVSVGAAGSILATAISQYYGFS